MQNAYLSLNSKYKKTSNYSFIFYIVLKKERLLMNVMQNNQKLFFLINFI